MNWCSTLPRLADVDLRLLIRAIELTPHNWPFGEQIAAALNELQWYRANAGGTDFKVFVCKCDPTTFDRPVPPPCNDFEMLTDENGIPQGWCLNCSHDEACHEQKS